MLSVLEEASEHPDLAVKVILLVVGPVFADVVSVGVFSLELSTGVDVEEVLS